MPGVLNKIICYLYVCGYLIMMLYYYYYLPRSCSESYFDVIMQVDYYSAVTTKSFVGFRNLFENMAIGFVVIILVVTNLSYKELPWLPLGKTYVTNEITSNFCIIIICQNRKLFLHIIV